jgi:Tol biopolymer transport system component
VHFGTGIGSKWRDQGKIVFVSDHSGSWQIYTVNTEGADLFQVTNLAPTEDDGRFPSLSPNGKEIAFNYNAGDGPDLFVIKWRPRLARRFRIPVVGTEH